MGEPWHEKAASLSEPKALGSEDRLGSEVRTAVTTATDLAQTRDRVTKRGGGQMEAVHRGPEAVAGWLAG